MAGATTRLTNATLATGELVDVTISAGDRDTAGAGRIVAVDPAAGAQRSPGDRHDEHVEHDDLTVELAGHLLTTSLVEPHAHLDKAFLAERIPNPTGDLIGAIHGMHANRDLITVADTIERAERAVRLMVNNGVTLIRTHADVTDANGLTSVEALAEVRRRTAGLCDLQIVALPGFPLTGPAGAPTRALLREALDTGADLVGGCPHLEDDVDGATEVLLAIAAEFGRGVDLHTDETLNPSKLGLADLARRCSSPAANSTFSRPRAISPAASGPAAFPTR
ncbi:MAG TPA: hypothetical protein PLV68_01595 [Ilumatobacteraceae bacterium]|nr:hypothetical protein [Ilumatobacteraceae bacterium]